MQWGFSVLNMVRTRCRATTFGTNSLKHLEMINKKKGKAEARQINGGKHLEKTKDKECNLTESDLGKCHVKNTRQTFGKPAANAAMRSITSNIK